MRVALNPMPGVFVRYRIRESQTQRRSHVGMETQPGGMQLHAQGLLDFRVLPHIWSPELGEHESCCSKAPSL